MWALGASAGRSATGTNHARRTTQLRRPRRWHETPEQCLQACTFIEENAQYQIEAEVLGGAKPFPNELWEQLIAERRGGRVGGGGTMLLWNYWAQIVEEEGVPLQAALAKEGS